MKKKNNNDTQSPEDNAKHLTQPFGADQSALGGKSRIPSSPSPFSFYSTVPTYLTRLPPLTCPTPQCLIPSKRDGQCLVLETAFSWWQMEPPYNT